MPNFAKAFFAATLATTITLNLAHADPVANDMPVLDRATDLGPLDSDQEITLLFALPMRDAPGAERLLAHLYTLGDPLYRHYLRPSEFAARFGGNIADAATLATWASAHALTPMPLLSSGTVLPITGKAGDIDAALGTAFRRFRTADGHSFYAASNPPSLPDDLAGKLEAVLGLTDKIRTAPLVVIKSPTTPGLAEGSGPNGAFTAHDLRAIYSIPQASPAAPQTLAVFEQGGFFQSDIDQYRKANNLPAVPVIVRNVNGFDGGLNGPIVELEAVLDIDMEIGINPRASRVLVYEDGKDSYETALLLSLAAMAKDNEAETISISYGLDEVIVGTAFQRTEKPLLMQLAVQGQAVLASSGDSGAYGDTGLAQQQAGQKVTLNVSDPASQPFVTAVGGTTLFVGPQKTYLLEQPWNEFNAGYGATGGGVSALWPIPKYQAPSTPAVNGGSGIYRNLPDVTAVGDPITGVAVYSELYGGWVTVGGTSVSSPIWAATASILNSASETFQQGRIGFLNPLLYRVAINAAPFGLLTDIVDGTNGNAATFGIDGYFAAPGYDDTSGLESIAGGTAIFTTFVKFGHEAKALPVPGKPVVLSAHPTSLDVAWIPSAGAAGYAVIAQGPFLKVINAAVTSQPKATLLGLLPGTTYTVTVFAMSSQGEKSSFGGTTVTTPAR